MDLKDECGICLDEFKARKCKTFPCLNHYVHIDCLDVWEKSQREKGDKEFLCIFRCKQKDVGTLT